MSMPMSRMQILVTMELNNSNGAHLAALPRVKEHHQASLCASERINYNAVGAQTQWPQKKKTKKHCNK